jgi:hypothetical protein
MSTEELMSPHGPGRAKTFFLSQETARNGWRSTSTRPFEHVLLFGAWSLLWAGRLPEGPQHMGGLLREYDWDGDVLWEDRHVGQHHDFRRLPNGNAKHNWRRIGRSRKAGGYSASALSMLDQSRWIAISRPARVTFTYFYKMG